MPIPCLARGPNGECLIEKDSEEMKEGEYSGWDDDGKCRYKEKGQINWQVCSYYMEDPYIKILCIKKHKQKRE